MQTDSQHYLSARPRSQLFRRIQDPISDAPSLEFPQHIEICNLGPAFPHKGTCLGPGQQRGIASRFSLPLGSNYLPASGFLFLQVFLKLAQRFIPALCRKSFCKDAAVLFLQGTDDQIFILIINFHLFSPHLFEKRCAKNFYSGFGLPLTGSPLHVANTFLIKNAPKLFFCLRT